MAYSQRDLVVSVNFDLYLTLFKECTVISQLIA